MNILGLSCFYHDSAACLLKDGVIVAAAQEERFTRKKHDAAFPHKAIQYCLKEAGLSVSDIDLIVFYDKPFLKFERLLETYFSHAPIGFSSYLKAIPVWIKEKLWIPSTIKKELGYEGKILFAEHHQSHAASAFFPSPFDEAAVLTVDGVGEWATTSWGVGSGNTLEMKEEIHFPHSLGLLYSAFTYYLGFKVNSGEYKVMGLAPYGEPKYANLIRTHLVDIKSDGSFRLNMEYFNYPAGLTMTSQKFHDLFGGPPRKPESPLTQKEMDIAASLQTVTEEMMLSLARYVREKSGKRFLCLAGGVALNCVANGRILREKIFDDIWIEPASGDAGGALGAALSAWYQYLGNERKSDNVHDKQSGTLLGPAYTDEEIKSFLTKENIPHEHHKEDELFPRTAALLADENVIGWFQGRMEFGPRALGARSILGDARSLKMQSKMNLKIKFRESFRPFAPIVLETEANKYFEIDRPSPYMLLTAFVRKERQLPMTEVERNLFGIEKLNIVRSDIPSVTHIDYSARLQTVDEKRNPRLHRLLRAFLEKTGSAVLVNTSFNVRGEPIVCSPEDAYLCFMRTDMDYLVLGKYILDKKQQPKLQEKEDWQKTYELD
jgi:carbamoyltransferase